MSIKVTQEALVKRELKKFFTSLGAYWFMPATHGYGRSGVPDFVVCFNGRFWGVECKGMPSNRTTALQGLELFRISQANGSVAVVDKTNLEAFKTAFIASADAVLDLRRASDKIEG